MAIIMVSLKFKFKTTVSLKVWIGKYIQPPTYYLCIFATLSELLHCVGMLYVVHRHGIDHHHSVVFSETNFFKR